MSNTNPAINIDNVKVSIGPAENPIVDHVRVGIPVVDGKAVMERLPSMAMLALKRGMEVRLS
jgi:hypothetical protein